MGLNNETMMYKVDKENENQAREILLTVYDALREKGYNPISQIVGYIFQATLLTLRIIIMLEVS